MPFSLSVELMYCIIVCFVFSFQHGDFRLASDDSTLIDYRIASRHC